MKFALRSFEHQDKLAALHQGIGIGILIPLRSHTKLLWLCMLPKDLL